MLCFLVVFVCLCVPLKHRVCSLFAMLFAILLCDVVWLVFGCAVCVCCVRCCCCFILCDLFVTVCVMMYGVCFVSGLLCLCVLLVMYCVLLSGVLSVRCCVYPMFVYAMLFYLCVVCGLSCGLVCLLYLCVCVCVCLCNVCVFCD